MVPTQLKMLSPSGNAEMPASALVCFFFFFFYLQEFLLGQGGQDRKGERRWVFSSTNSREMPNLAPNPEKKKKGRGYGEEMSSGGERVCDAGLDATASA